MKRFDRTNTSIIGRWWWTVDRVAFSGLVLLMIAGGLLVMAGSPPVAARLGLDDFHFVTRQWVFLGLGLGLMVVVSMMPMRLVLWLSVAGCAFMLLLMMAIPFIGDEAKGAARWLSVGGISIQPSEFLKPFFAVVCAWLFAEPFHRPDFRGRNMAIGLYALVVALLLIQPDFGMTVTVSVIWGIQFFLSGLALTWVGLGAALGALGSVLVYLFLPHVRARINSFFDPSDPGNFQVQKSLEAMQHGGLFGVGPGEGTVKRSLPDSHTDFIFATVGEEFGLLACLLLLGAISMVFFRGLLRTSGEKNLFVVIAVAGLLVQFAVQALINMGVSVALLPTKGMTLPFISYGGSSTLAFAIAMGMMLALTRQRFGEGRPRSATADASVIYAMPRTG